MRTFLTLNLGGVVTALTLGVLLLVLGFASGANLFFLAVMFYFLLISAIVTRVGKATKVKLKLYERARGWRNVLANGLMPLIIAFIYVANIHLNLVQPSILLIVYVACIAAITADKFASEIGVLDGKPWMLLTMRKVEKGVSGAVSPIGLVASLIGSFLICLTLFQFTNFPLVLAVATVSGFLGNIADSVFGYFEEQGIGNKYTSNAICSIVGAILALIMIMLLA